MIPRIIHYCWFGRSPMPELALKCIDSWHQHMPDWEYKLWNEDNFDINQNTYAKEAYEAGKFAFVSDYVRLWALVKEGGVYLDTDVEVFKSLEDLLSYSAFAGFEGSKYHPMGTCVIASEAYGQWAQEMLRHYENRHFLREYRFFDLTTNVQYISAIMRGQGFVQNGEEQEYKDLHIFPVDFFCPRQTTGEYLRTENTYCDHLGLGSWSESGGGWKAAVGRMVGPRIMPALVKLKRKFIG